MHEGKHVNIISRTEGDFFFFYTKHVLEDLRYKV